jgi:signal transduction histidine kinase
VRALLLGAVLAFAPAAHAQGAEAVQTIERAEVVVASPGWLPADDEAWRPVSLPHAWFRDPPAASWVWYRLRIELAALQAGSYRIYFPRTVVNNMAVYVNRELVWRQTDVAAVGSTLTAVLIAVPSQLLRPGENQVHLRVQGNPAWFHGMSRLYFGEAAALAKAAAQRNLLQTQMIYAMGVALGFAGLLTFALWWGNRRDAVLFWYGVTGAGLFLATLAWNVTLLEPDFGEWRTLLVFLRYYGFLTPLFVLHLRLAGRRHLWLEGALWLLLAAACLGIGPRHAWNAGAWMVSGLFYAVLPLFFLFVLAGRAAREGAGAVWLLMLTDIAAAAFGMHDWAVRAALLDFDRPFLIFYVVPFIMLAAGAAILRRHLDGLRALRQDAAELEQRVVAKTREIEASHARLREAEHEQALARERRRIMADMHDGLGSRLVGLLSLAQSGRSDAGELGRGIAAALDELRLAIDSLEPVEGDVGVVLGNVRHRMRAVLERAGVRFVWNVGELPRIDDLTPARILAIQRVLLEVFSNAIKHAAASTLTVSTVRAPGVVSILIEDDGRGFDVANAPMHGRGLENLRLRAGQAGGTIKVESTAERGTRVTLALPVAGEPGEPSVERHAMPFAERAPPAGPGDLPDAGDLPRPAPRPA